MRDLCAVQDEVMAQLPLSSPYVLVGQSGGGNLDIGCAARHPGRVAGLVTIDSYHARPGDAPRPRGRAKPVALVLLAPGVGFGGQVVTEILKELSRL
jgi:pimeloyl-ACP methyl ester carboxylesterase